MYKSYEEIVAKVKDGDPVTISVAIAHDLEVLETIKMAQEVGFVNAILVGNAELIKPMLTRVGLSTNTSIIDVKDEEEGMIKAVTLVREKKAQVLMKGLINSSDFLKVILDKEVGLRKGTLISHLAAFEIPGQKKIVFHTDGGINIAPNLEQKKDIVINAIKALENMGIKNPKVAILAANEKINPKMPTTVDADALVSMRKKGIISSGIIEGPIAMDVAVSPEAAKHKGIQSKITGDVDLFVVPDIEAGNLIGKTLIYYAGAKMAGLILGATNPIVMTSRAETAEGRFNSIALACLAAAI